MDLTFPARDQSIRRIVSVCSEITTARHADNFVTNEDSIPAILGELASRAEKTSVYLGVGPDQNFSMIAQARPALAFVVDFRRRNLLLHLIHKAIFALSPDRVTYLQRITCRNPAELDRDAPVERLVEAFQAAAYSRSNQLEWIRDVRVLLEPLEIIRDDEWQELAIMQTRLAGPGLNAKFLALPMYPTSARLILAKGVDGERRHFLSNEPFYQTVRELQRNDRLVPIVGDFAGSRTFSALGDWLQARRFQVGVFYVSDVEFFLIRQGGFASYLANLERIPWSKSAVLVRTSTREIDHPRRVRGDSSTTILESDTAFLKRARDGRVISVDDLFDPRAIVLFPILSSGREDC